MLLAIAGMGLPELETAHMHAHVHTCRSPIIVSRRFLGASEPHSKRTWRCRSTAPTSICKARQPGRSALLRALSLSLSSFLFLSPCLQELAEFRRLLTSTSSLRRRAPRLRQLLPNCTSALPGSCEEQLCLEHRWPEKSQKSSDVLWASVCLPATGAGAAGLSSEPPAPQEAPGSAAVTEVSEAERRKPALSFKSFASSCLDLIRDSIT